MRSPSKASFLGTMIAILFLLCTGSISSVFARVPLVRRKSNVESQWAQALPGGVVVVDGPEMGNNILNEQVLADTYPVCCTLQETLIETAITICEKGMSLSFNFTGYYYFFLPLSSQTPSIPISSFLAMYFAMEKKWRERISFPPPPRIQTLIMRLCFPSQSHQKPFATAPYMIVPCPPLNLRM